MEIEQYRKEFVEQIRIDASSYGITPDEQFVQDIVERLTSMDELTDPVISYFGQRGPKQAMMKIDGYSIDPSDKTLILFLSDFRNTTEKETITMTDLETKYGYMKNFLQACVSGVLANYCDDSNEYVKVANDIKRRFAIKYVNEGEDESIEKIKLIVFTNASLSARIKNLPNEEFQGRKVERAIWSLERFFELDAQGLEREPVEIHVPDFGHEGIPCLKAEMSQGLDYDAYLAIIPGKLLSDLYYKYGSRLLEGNVRAFLSNKGKINQGIRRTILTEPTKFFTYNNGIACTAQSITLSQTASGLMITDMRDLQIINGGQTTASLTSAFLKDGSKLENIFVPVKITVIRGEEEYDDMVQKISRYANSQNKVTDADFFSNHPFHVQFEQLSRRVIAPAAKGSISQTMWYYERSRGKYNQEMFKMKEGQRNAFQIKNPKNQIIKKEELGKYYNTIMMKPFWVVRGAAKNMNEFAKDIDEIWTKRKQDVNEVFFKKLICAAIMFRQTDKMVAKAPWYETGGFKSQVIPYTLAKILASLPEGYTLDWDRIWRTQEMYPALVSLVETVAEETNRFIQDSNGALVSEYVKREQTWKTYKARSINLPREFLATLVSESLEQEKQDSASKETKMQLEIDVEAEIFRLGGQYWRNLLQEGQERGVLGPKDIGLLRVAASIDTSHPMIPSPAQAKAIWKIRDRLGKIGVII